MAKGYKIGDQHGIYFLTFTIVDWIDIFSRPVYKDLLIENLQFYSKQRGLLIYAYVIMSNHMHLIVRTPDSVLSDFVRDFKKRTSRKAIDLIHEINESRREWMLERFSKAGRANPRNREFQFWIQDSHPELIYSMKFADQKRNYIHQNPVKAKIVNKAEDYVYSNASNYAGLEGLLKITFLDLLGGEE